MDDQLTKVSSAMGQKTLKSEQINTAITKNTDFYRLKLDEKLQQPYAKIEAVYREIMARIVASLEDYTPENAEIHITEDKATKGLEIQTGMGNKRSTHSVIPFTPLAQELKESTEPIVFGKLSNSDPQSPNYILGQLIQAIDPTVPNASTKNLPTEVHRQNIIKFNGNRINQFLIIKDKEGNVIRNLSVRMVEALDRKGLTRTRIAKLFGVSDSNLSLFMKNVGNSRIKYNERSKEREDALLSFITTHLAGYKRTYPEIIASESEKIDYHWLDITEEEILKLAEQEGIDLGTRHPLEDTLISLSYKTKTTHKSIKTKLELFDKLTILGFNTDSLRDRLGAYIEAGNQSSKTLPKMAKELGIEYKTLANLIHREGLAQPITKEPRGAKPRK
jgi:transcriptional regulator with XRE-family HTH domain